MKKAALIFTLKILSIPILLTLFSYYFSNKTKLSEFQNYYNYLFDVLIVFVSGIITYVIILKNNQRKETALEALKNSIESMRISNERYNIVAKATSDSIWDWQFSNNTFIWNKGI